MKYGLLMQRGDSEMDRLSIAGMRGTDPDIDHEKCALTRAAIQAADCIYRPIPVRPPPVNSSSMILAAVAADVDVCVT